MKHGRRSAHRLEWTSLNIAISFLMGVLTTAVLAWGLSSGTSPLMTVSRGAPLAALSAPQRPADPAPAHDPAEPRAVERPGEHGEQVPPTLTGSVANGDAIESLRSRKLEIPVEGITRDALRDTFSDARDSRAHEALDIMAPRDTRVLAVEDGRIEKLFASKSGGFTIYQFDPGESFTYYYAHLDRYADGLHEGQVVRRGDVIGYVGSTGNASPEAPHLHFGIFRLTPERQWWKGEPINPYPVFASQ